MTRLSPATEFPPGSEAGRLDAFIAGERAILAWERVWPALWPASAIVGLFAAAALFGLPALLPWPLHALILAAVITATGLSLYFACEGLRWPGRVEGARRLERDSTLAHRPISESADALAAGRGDPWAEALWNAHLRRRLADIGHLRLSWPRSALPQRDPRALRFVVLLLVAMGLLVAGADWSRRLLAAFGPGAGDGGAIGLDAWIDPPPYTGEAPIYLTPGDTHPIAVPTGSLINLRIHGAGHAPSLSLDNASFEGGRGEYASTARLDADTHLRVRAGGRTIGDWELRALADQKPVIAFAAPPARTEHDALKLAFTAGDDYGVTAVKAIIRPHGRYGKPLVVDLALDAASAKTISQTSFRDLTAHPYAGLDVDIVLQAVDGAGQSGFSRAARFTLPARVFTNPLARALIEQRQVLGTGDVRLRPRVANMLEALSIAPQRFYQGQLGVYLALRAAYWTLNNASHDEDYAQVQDMLWQIATGLERGGLLSAAEQLRRLQQMLSQALAQGAPQEVIDSLLQRYREALQHYLQALAQNPPDAGTPPAPGAKVLSQQDLDTLLKAIEQMAQSGARGQAAQMLALLQSLLENLHMTNGSGSGSGSSPGDKALSDAIQGLGDLMGKERALLDKTFRQQQGKADPRDGGPKGLAESQRQLHDQLNKVLGGLGAQKQEAPKALGEAGKAMGQAQGALGAQDMPNAGSAEKDALDAMRKGASDLAKTLMGRGGQAGQQGTDPLGRAQGRNGADFGANVKVPPVSDLQRAREILKELRRRAAERGRPQQELDYIDRLLKQF